MPYPLKLRKLADERGVTERSLIIGAIEATSSLRDAALSLGVTEGAIRAAVKRMNLRITHGKQKVMR